MFVIRTGVGDTGTVDGNARRRWARGERVGGVEEENCVRRGGLAFWWLWK